MLSGFSLTRQPKKGCSVGISGIFVIHHELNFLFIFGDLRAMFIDRSTYHLQLFGGRVNIVISVFPKISTLTTIVGKW